MKRIFSILAIVCLLVALAVPTFATESYTISGEWHLVFPTNGYGLDITNAYPVSGTIEGKAFDSIDRNSYGISFLNGSTVVHQFEKTNVTQYDMVIDFGDSEQQVDADIYNWVHTYGVILVCTGETCPATDVNMDNICDDCAMAFAVPRQYAPPSGWPANVPTPPAQYETMILLTENDQTWLYMVDEPVNAVITEPTDYGERVLTLSFSADNTVQRYMLIDGVWAYNSVNSLRSFNFDQTLDFDFSTVDILDMYGNPFFPLPLWAEMGQVTQGEMSGLAATTDGTILTLVLCGVGLMALLVVLNLFGKRSLIYRR